MKFSKKQLAIIALVVILAVTNVTLAVLYMTKNVNISGGVSVVGAIEVYNEDRVTPLTAFDFPLFTGGGSESQYKDFYINNTGNQPVYLYWAISSSSISWTADNQGYYHSEDVITKYYFDIVQNWPPDPWNRWVSKDYSPPEAINLGVGDGIHLRFENMYTGTPKTSETYNLVVTFYAQDA